MKPLAAAMLTALAAASASGGPTERVILAAMKLSEQPNYSWSTSVSDDARSYVIKGKTQKGGCTWLRLPMVKSLAQRLGREADVEIEALFRGNAASVIRTERGWLTLRELPRRHWDWNDDEIELWPVMPASGVMSRAALTGVDPLALPPVSLPRTSFPYEREDEHRPYSNAQFAVSHPHDELAVIVSSYTHLKVDGDIATGVLSDIGAQLLLVCEGQDHIDPLRAAGTFKLLLQRDRVVKYFLRLEGILRVDRKRVHVHQTSMTVVNDIGATTIDVPHEARRKLGL